MIPDPINEEKIDLFLEALRQAAISVFQDTNTLSTSFIRQLNSTVPSVILMGDPEVTPKYPYIAIDLLSINETHSNERFMRYRELSTNLPVDLNQYRLRIAYTIYGGQAITIAHRLRRAFSGTDCTLMDEISSASGAALENVESNVVSTRIKKANRFYETAQLYLTFNMNDVYTPDTGVINSIVVDGTLQKHPENPNPQVIQIIASRNQEET